MLIVRAPMRISLAGGGTDIPAYYEKHGGMVVSAAIDKYVYVFITPNGRGALQVSSSDYSTFIRHASDDEVAEEGKLRYARAFLRHFGIRRGYSVFIASEMPPGTGLGSSSSLAVALSKALFALRDELPPRADVAETAASIEIERLQMPIGRQDHYSSAHGGINAFTFSKAGVAVEALKISDTTRDKLMESLAMFFTEQSHDSREILKEQARRSRSEDDEAMHALHAIRGHALEVRQALLDDEPERVGEILHRTWLEKRRLAHGITNEHIDGAYEAALASGALGGKIAGAGGGGFLLLFCEPGRRSEVTRAMEKRGLTAADFHLDSAGARILVNNAAS